MQCSKSHSSLHHHHHHQHGHHEKYSIPQSASLKERLHHFTWAWFACTLSTGGTALLLAAAPYRFPGLTGIGAAIFVLNLGLFLVLTVAILARFVLFAGSFMSSIDNPTESLFIPTFWMSLATMISCISKYGVPSSGPWLVTVVRVLFWIYTPMAFFAAIGHYYLLFSGIPMTVQSMTPGWLLPIFPVMLCGTLAAIIAPFQPSEHAIPILIAGLIFKGLGWMIAIFMYANYIARLMSAGLPTPSTRPGMFIAVGPPSFTALALIGMADAAIQHFPRELAVHGLDADFTPRVLKVMAVFAALFLWGLSLFFFFVSLVSVLVGVREMKFHLTWWSFVFPNTGFIIATIQIGTAIASKAVLWFATVLIVLEVCMWLFVGLAHIKAVRDGQILWPGKDEDSHY